MVLRSDIKLLKDWTDNDKKVFKVSVLLAVDEKTREDKMSWVCFCGTEVPDEKDCPTCGEFYPTHSEESDENDFQ